MMAGDALGLMNALGIDRAHVLGVSMGGMIAQELALASPERVRSLHLACTFGRPDAYMLALNAAWREMRIGLGRESTLRALGLWLFSPTTYAERPELIEALLQNALANPYPQSLAGFLRQGEAVAAHDALERLSAIRCPTLVSVAEDDILVPPRFSREIVARIHGAELRLVIGPLTDTETATRLCAVLSAARRYCQPAPFEGQPFAFDLPGAESKPATAIKVASTPQRQNRRSKTNPRSPTP